MKVFISWSGDLAQSVAIILRDWIPSVIQAVVPWVSSEDIEKGSAWYTKVAGQLDESRLGIIVVTKQNKDKPWLNYEAGALAKSILTNSGLVMPLLVDLTSSDIQGPLTQLQVTPFTRPELKKLVTAINGQVGVPLSDALLNETFDERWVKLESRVAEAIASAAEPEPLLVSR